VQATGWRFDEPSGAASEQIVERRRISFAPNAAWKEGRYNPFNCSAASSPCRRPRRWRSRCPRR
jgi:hypothetical protein